MALVLVESDSAGFHAQISSQKREAGDTHPLGESWWVLFTLPFNTLIQIIWIKIWLIK